MSGEKETSTPRDDAHRLAEVLRRGPTNPTLLFQFATACGQSGENALEASVLAELLPRDPANPILLAYYAQALDETQRLGESLQYYEQSLAIDPKNPAIRASYSLALLRAGDFARGWEFYAAREEMPRLVPQLPAGITAPRYAGGNLHGRTILAIGEQGLGDTVMFARYAPLLAKRGARVVLGVPDPLAELIATVPGVSQVVRFGQRLTPFHTWTLLMSLPRTFATTVTTIPNDVPYLRAPAARLFPWRERLHAIESAREPKGEPPVRRVGLVWAGNPRQQRDVHRSMHLHDFAPLAQVPDVQFYALQKGAREAEADDPPPGMNLVNLGPQLNDIADLTAVLQLLDLLICVDTAPAHIAGALAKPVWSLLSFAADWRWLLDREDSPWYPTMRLFRQSTPRDWTAPLMRARDALLEWASSPVAPQTITSPHPGS